MLFALVCARLCTKVSFFCKNLCIVCFLFALSGNSITFGPWIPALQRWCEEGLYRKKGVIVDICLDSRRNRFRHLYFIFIRMPNGGGREAEKELAK